jgi:hypothetical protein
MDNQNQIQDLLNTIKKHEERILFLENELNETKIHLKKYTAPPNMKKYYEANKEVIKQKVKEYRIKNNYKIPKEIAKERNKRAYLKRKEKLEKENI